MKNTLSFAKPLLYLYPMFNLLLPSHGCTLEEIGHAMIHVTMNGYTKHILENSDISSVGTGQ